MRENLTLVVLFRSLGLPIRSWGGMGTGVALNERGSDPKRSRGGGRWVWAENL